MATYNGQVNASENDGYLAGSWDYATGSMGIGKAFLGNAVISAVRFTNVTIPQGATITGVSLIIIGDSDDSDDVNVNVYGIDEDNTADFSSDPTGRTKTTAYMEGLINGIDANGEAAFVNGNMINVVQEIVDRGSWSSGNAMGFIFDGTPSDNDNIIYFKTYDGDDTKAATLEITYSTGGSASLSPSASTSASSSASASKSASASASASPSPIEPFNGLKIAKPNINVLNTQEPFDLIFSSDYGTLKYYTKETASFTINAADDDIAGTATITHDLGYYPYVEVFVSVYIGDPTGVYQYCPFAGAGAVVAYDANYKITTSNIVLYGQINGISDSLWHFDFLVFIFKNNLQLS